MKIYSSSVEEGYEVVIPYEIRKLLEVKPGMDIAFVIEGGRITLQQVDSSEETGGNADEDDDESWETQIEDESETNDTATTEFHNCKRHDDDA